MASTYTCDLCITPTTMRNQNSGKHILSKHTTHILTPTNIVRLKSSLTEKLPYTRLEVSNRVFLYICFSCGTGVKETKWIDRHTAAKPECKAIHLKHVSDLLTELHGVKPTDDTTCMNTDSLDQIQALKKDIETLKKQLQQKDLLLEKQKKRDYTLNDTIDRFFGLIDIGYRELYDYIEDRYASTHIRGEIDESDIEQELDSINVSDYIKDYNKQDHYDEHEHEDM